jgi:hypothetical protein
MFDDLAGDSGFSIDSVEKSSQQNQAPQQQAQSSGYQQQRQEQGGYNGGSYGNNASSNGGGGYQQNQGGGGYQQRQGGGGGYGGGGGFQRQGGGGFQRKEDVVSPPYLPVAFFVEKETPPEIKQKFYHLASKLIGKGYTIRLNPDDPDFVRQVQALSTKNVELYLPWRNFNQLESKHTFNTLTSKDVAQRHFPAWEKIPDAVKAMLANQVRMIFGDRNNSIALMLITFSPDGASRIAEITKDTGRVSFIIKMACSYGFSVVNMGKQSSESLLEKYFDLQ